MRSGDAGGGGFGVEAQAAARRRRASGRTNDRRITPGPGSGAGERLARCSSSSFTSGFPAYHVPLYTPLPPVSVNDRIPASVRFEWLDRWKIAA